MPNSEELREGLIEAIWDEAVDVLVCAGQGHMIGTSTASVIIEGIVDAILAQSGDSSQSQPCGVGPSDLTAGLKAVPSAARAAFLNEIEIVGHRLVGLDRALAAAFAAASNGDA